MIKKITTIAISVDLAKYIKKHKITKLESYDEILTRLLMNS